MNVPRRMFTNADILEDIGQFDEEMTSTTDEDEAARPIEEAPHQKMCDAF